MQLLLKKKLWFSAKKNIKKNAEKYQNMLSINWDPEEFGWLFRMVIFLSPTHTAVDWWDWWKHLSAQVCVETVVVLKRLIDVATDVVEQAEEFLKMV